MNRGVRRGKKSGAALVVVIWVVMLLSLLVMGIANVGKLYPQLVDITQEASRLALKNLDEKLGN